MKLAISVLASAILWATVSFGAPGGFLVEGLSDECDSINPIWMAGLRGMPEMRTIEDGAMSIRSFDNGDDDYPSAEDMTTTYSNQIGRPLSAAEGPSVVAWIWLPPFNEWSTGTNASGFREWFGVRATAYDSDLPLGNGFYYPGIYVATDDAGPCLIARAGDGYGPDITIGRVDQSGWWTFGLAFNAEGVTEYYATPGRVALTSADLLHVSPRYLEPAANRSIDQLVGNFIALRMTYPPTGLLSPDWRMDNFRVYVKTLPALPALAPRLENNQVGVEIAGGARGFRYLLQRSNDLRVWETLADYVGDGNVVTYSEPAATRVFYRVARP